MNVLWGTLMIAIGMFMFLCGKTRSQFVIYRLMVARSRILWGDRVHGFHQVVGVIVAIFGAVMALWRL